MAFCSNCGTQMGDGAKFCASCGTQAGGASPAPQPAAEKVGNIRKCPACGAEVPAMTAVCPSCGHEFSNVQVANSLQAFVEKLDALDRQAYEDSQSATGKSLLGDIGSTFAKQLSKKQGGSAICQRKCALIAGFPIPNSKEDILEFIVLATSRYTNVQKKVWGIFKIDPSMMTDDQLIDEAWKAKCDQAYNKAKLSFGSDKDTIAYIENLLKEKKLLKK